MRNLTACCLLFCLCLTVNARVETFRNREVEEGESLSNKIVFITAKDSIIGSDDPTFSADQKISLKSTSTNVQFTNNSILHILFFPVDVRVGVTDEEGVVQYCCTKELIEEGKCVDDGALIILDEDDKVPTIYREYLFTNATTEFVWKENWKINSSGSYNLLYINCKGSELGDVVIEGTITYINPFGQLSAESYPLLWFFGFMTFVIMITAAIWLVFIAYYRKSLLSLQHFISGVLLLELFESFIWFLMFWVANRTGEIHWGWITITVLTSSVKRTSVGLLYLLISLGYGIMNKSRIGNNKKMIIIVILFYFAVSTGQELITSYIREGVVSSDVEVFLGFAALVLLFPSVVIPLGLFWWICACLSKTIQKVKLRQQNAKLELYTKILITLIVACTVVLLMILMETGISIMDSDQSWRVWWLFTAFWFVVFFCLTGSLLVLLHPSKNPKWLVSYTASLSDEDDEYYTSGIELDDLEKDMEIDFDFDLGFDDIGEEETSKLS